MTFAVQRQGILGTPILDITSNVISHYHMIKTIYNYENSTQVVYTLEYGFTRKARSIMMQ